MAIYRNVYLSFWTDPKVDDKFTPEDKYFYLFLLTNPHTTLSGCYEISMRQLTGETGYNEDTVLRLLKRFEYEHDVIRYSEKNSEILILNWSKYNWTSSDTFRKAVQSETKSIKTEAFRNFVEEALRSEAAELPEAPQNEGVSIPYNEQNIPYAYPIDTVSIPYPPVTVTVTDTVTDTDTVCARAREAVCDCEIISEKPIEKENAPSRDKAFEEFWSVYPKQVGRDEAFRQFKNIQASVIPELMKALEQHKISQRWQTENGRYIPYPANWLKRECWKDKMPDKASKKSREPPDSKNDSEQLKKTAKKVQDLARPKRTGQ